MQDDQRRLLALLLVSAADADQHIHPREEKIIRMGLGTEVYRSALEEYRNADAAGRAQFQSEISALLEDEFAKERALDLLKRIFLADGRYDRAEADWMKKVWDRLT